MKNVETVGLLPGMCFFLMGALQNVLLQLVKRHQFIALVANFLGLIRVILYTEMLWEATKIFFQQFDSNSLLAWKSQG